MNSWGLALASPALKSSRRSPNLSAPYRLKPTTAPGNLPRLHRFAALKPRAKAWSLADRSHWAAKCALLAVDRQLASLNCLGELGRRGDLRQNIGGCRGPSWQRKRGSSTLRLRWRAIFFEV